MALGHKKLKSVLWNGYVDTFIVCHFFPMSHSFHLSRLNYLNNVRWSEQRLELLICLDLITLTMSDDQNKAWNCSSVST